MKVSYNNLTFFPSHPPSFPSFLSFHSFLSPFFCCISHQEIFRIVIDFLSSPVPQPLCYWLSLSSLTRGLEDSFCGNPAHFLSLPPSLPKNTGYFWIYSPDHTLIRTLSNYGAGISCDYDGSFWVVAYGNNRISRY